MTTSMCPTNLIPLEKVINHTGAPIEFTAKYGNGILTPFYLACPICGISEITIDPAGSIIVERPDGREIEIPLSRNEILHSRPNCAMPGVWLALHCSKGHRFILTISQEDGSVNLACILRDGSYVEAYPDAFPQMDDELSDYDEEVRP